MHSNLQRFQVCRQHIYELSYFIGQITFLLIWWSLLYVFSAPSGFQIINFICFEWKFLFKDTLFETQKMSTANKLFTNKLFMSRIFMYKLFMNKLFMNKLCHE